MQSPEKNNGEISMHVVISSGHGLKVRGAAGPPPWGLDEVNEARKVVERTADYLRQVGVEVATYHDDVSTSQNENLQRIVDFHNSKARDLDVSVHFNAYQVTSKPMGTECLFVTQESLAGRVAEAISEAGDFLDRGPKYRSDLFFLNNTAEPAILIETCFVDSQADAALYRAEFEAICAAIAEAISGQTIDEAPVEPSEPPPIEPPTEPPPVGVELFPPYTTDLKCSVFGGGDDPNNSAYTPYDAITETELSVALPYKFAEPRPLVLVHNLATGREAICKIRDVGPWLTDDPYWQNNRRPLAETCHENKMKLPRGPHKGKTPNGAGIDITPAAATAIGLSGMGQVSWKFITEPAIV
jgi:N-acetylmuramoyl-L-alanine amidase